MRISDQSAAIKLAICDDIGERSYDVADVAAILVQMLTKLPTVGMWRDRESYSSWEKRHFVELSGWVSFSWDLAYDINVSCFTDILRDALCFSDMCSVIYKVPQRCGQYYIIWSLFPLKLPILSLWFDRRRRHSS